MNLPESEKLNIASLSRLFDNKSECYKLFWFQAILTYVCKGQQEITFEELIDEMIADAWYMVTEYHLNLGPKDTLKKTVNYIAETTNMLPSVKKKVILGMSEQDAVNIDNVLKALKLSVGVSLKKEVQTEQRTTLEYYISFV